MNPIAYQSAAVALAVSGMTQVANAAAPVHQVPMTLAPVAEPVGIRSHEESGEFVVSDTYVGPERRRPELPFGPGVESRTAIMCGFQAISSGQDARRYLEALKSGDTARLQRVLEEAVMIGDAWERLHEENGGGR